MPAVMPAMRETATEDRLGKLLAMARSRLQAAGMIAGEPPAPAPEPLVGRAPLQGRRVASVDDDLFEDAPAAFDRGLQDRFGGARR